MRATAGFNRTVSGIGISITVTATYIVEGFNRTVSGIGIRVQGVNQEPFSGFNRTFNDQLAHFMPS